MVRLVWCNSLALTKTASSLSWDRKGKLVQTKPVRRSGKAFCLRRFQQRPHPGRKQRGATAKHHLQGSIPAV